MARFKFTLDKEGIAEILKSQEVADAIFDAANEVHTAVDAMVGADAADGVVLDEYETDRAAASVTIRDVRALMWEATEGVMSKAIDAAGLERGRRS